MTRRLRRAALQIPAVLALYRALPRQLTPHYWRLKSKTPEQVFTDIYNNRSWGARDSISGSGSDLQQTRDIAGALPSLLDAHGISTILDIPCGDFHWMQHVDLAHVEYTGADIVRDLIAQNAARYTRPGVCFQQMDVLESQLPAVDLVLCRDCLVHFSFDDAFRALRNICASQSTLLLTTTFTGRTRNRDIATGQWRPLNLERPPFNLPAPVATISEGCTEGDGSYRDKALGLWRIADIQSRRPWP